MNYIKESGGEKFAILNIGMNNLMRPALYDAYHQIIPIKIIDKKEIYHIAGPICESSDFFTKNREMTELQEGDFGAILSAGAYG